MLGFTVESKSNDVEGEGMEWTTEVIEGDNEVSMVQIVSLKLKLITASNYIG